MLKNIVLAVGFVMVICSGLFLVEPSFAKCPDGTVPVSVIGADDMIEQGTEGERCLKDDGNGSSVMHILELVVDIMTIGVGILGVVGISIVGVQYLTAGGNEEKTRKAKRRMFEIIIGLAAYAVLYMALKWLLPSFD